MTPRAFANGSAAFCRARRLRAPGGCGGFGSGGGHLPRRREAEVFDGELEHVHQEPLVVGPRPRRVG